MSDNFAIQDANSQKPSTTEELVLLAKSEYQIVKTLENDYLAIPYSHPKIAKSLHGMDNTLADDLMRRYREVTRKVPSERSVRDAIRVLISEANMKDAVKAYIRCAQIGNEIYVDIGDATGHVIHIFPGGWKIIDSAPVVFRRTALTGPLPRPLDRGDFSKLFSIINVSKESEGLVLGFLVCSFFEAIPKPILGLNGEQGSGKSDSARRLSFLVDPSPAALQSPPKDQAAWIELAAGSYVISLDNLSHIPIWLSDSLCRAATGDSLVKRKNYSDKDLVVHQFKRVVIINGINLTVLRDDLADRVIPINAPIISSTRRKYESHLERDWITEFPEIFGGILTLCSKVLEIYEFIEMPELPRMADFARILKAIDMVRDTDSLTSYLDEVGKMASNAVDGDKFFKVVAGSINGEWIGTAAELLEKVSTLGSLYSLDKGWPQTAHAVTDRLTRTGPTLRKVGWIVEDLGSNNEKKTKRWRLSPPTGETGVIFKLHTQKKEVGGDVAI